MQVRIDDVVTPLAVGGLSIDNAIGQRSTASLLLLDSNGSYHYEDGQRVDVTDDAGNLVYSGVLDSDDEAMPDSAPSTGGLLTHSVACKDWHYLADKRRAAVSYASGMTCGAVIRSLRDTILVDEGVFSVVNLLSANQSSVETDTTGFGSGAATISRDTTTAWNGAASLKIVTTGSGDRFASIVGSVTLGSFGGCWAVTPGAQYTLSAYLKSDGTAAVTLRIIELSSGGAVLRDMTLSPSTTATSFTRLTQTYTAGASAAGVLLRVQQSSVAFGSVWADGLQWEQYATARTWELGGHDTIANGPTLPDVIFNYATVAACLDAVTQKAGNYWWQIDQDKRLWFQPYAALPAPWALVTDANGRVADARRGTVKVKRAKPLYRNRQIVRGATGQTNAQTESRKGDGNTTAFTFGYPFAKVPTVTVNSVSKTVGIKGVDSGKDWYWNAGDPTLTQDSAATKLASSDTLQCVYIGQFPVIIISEDTAQITAQQLLEGGGTSGRVEEVTEDSSLSTQDAAFTEAAALLTKYGQKAVTLQFQTRRSGLAPGQLLTVTIPQHGFSAAQFLIQSIHISDEDGQVIWYDVTAIQGPVNQTWIEFFGQLVTNANTTSESLSVGSNSTLVIAENISGSITPGAAYTATVYACPLFPFTFPATLC